MSVIINHGIELGGATSEYIAAVEINGVVVLFQLFRREATSPTETFVTTIGGSRAENQRILDLWHRYDELAGHAVVNDDDFLPATKVCELFVNWVTQEACGNRL